MSTNSAIELAAVAATQSSIDAMAVVTLSPEKYAAEVYQPFKDRLDAAIDSVRTADYDITTTAGMASAIKLRALFRDLRIDADKERKVRKEPITKIGKLLEFGFDLIEERVAPLEDLFDSDIQAETKRKADERAAKERAEAERIAGIRVLIDAIRIRPAKVVGATSDEIYGVMAELSMRAITEAEFSKFAGEAQVALETVQQELEVMHAAAVEREAAAVAAEQARIAEAAALREREAAVLQLKQEAEAQAEGNRRAQAEIDRQRTELVAAQAAAKEAADNAERARVAAETKRQLEEKAAQAAAERAANERAAANLQAQTRESALAEARASIARQAAANAAANAAAAPEMERTASFYGDAPTSIAVAPATSTADLFDAADNGAERDIEFLASLADAKDMTLSALLDRLAAIDFDAVRAELSTAA